jgi:hypothetical protein
MKAELEIQKKANKGEWGEIYTFFRILNDREVLSADENLNFIEGKNYKVLKVIRSELSEGSLITREYDVQLPGQTVVRNLSEGTERVIELKDLKKEVRTIFEKILSASGSSFTLPEAQKLMKEYECGKVKASSNDKSDIELVIQDRFSPNETKTGFSIKTALVSSKPTLFNAFARNTNIIYSTDAKIDEQEVEKLNSLERRERVMFALENLRFDYKELEGSTLAKNLALIDSEFAIILSTMISLFYRRKGRSIAEIVSLLPSAPELEYLNQTEDYYAYKVKNFLESAALGMTAASPWTGRIQANGGYLVVRKDGELCCYHLHEREKFLDYLFMHTKFDTPSASKHRFGEIEIDKDGSPILKLNFQIRFI